MEYYVGIQPLKWRCGTEMGERQRLFVEALKSFPNQILASEGYLLLQEKTGVEIPVEYGPMHRIRKIAAKARNRVGFRVVQDGNEYWWVRKGVEFALPNQKDPRCRREHKRRWGLQKLAYDLMFYKPRFITTNELANLFELYDIPNRESHDLSAIRNWLHKAGYHGFEYGPNHMRPWCRNDLVWDPRSAQILKAKTHGLPRINRTESSRNSYPGLSRLLLISLMSTPTHCLVCSQPLSELAESTGGHFRKYCSPQCRKTSENRRGRDRHVYKPHPTEKYMPYIPIVPTPGSRLDVLVSRRDEQMVRSSVPSSTRTTPDWIAGLRVKYSRASSTT